jgi:hypothetical protein
MAIDNKEKLKNNPDNCDHDVIWNTLEVNMIKDENVRGFCKKCGAVIEVSRESLRKKL